MAAANKIEGYLINLGVTYQEINESTLLVNDPDKGLDHLVITVEEPLVFIRVRVMPIPTARREGFFEHLLRLNGSDLIHGAYALGGDFVELVDTLEYATLNLEEFQASLDAIGLALAQHYVALSEYRDH